MIALHVARVELGRLIRSPGAWLSTLGFVLVVAVGVAIPQLATADADARMGAAFLLGPGVDLLLPLVAVVYSYGAIARHRDRGTLHVFFHLPIDRSGVLAGTCLARLGVLVGIVSCGLVAGVATCVFLYGRPPVIPTLGFVGVTLLAAISYTAIGVGVSAALATPTRVLATLIGGFVVAHTLWEPLVSGLADVTGLERTSPRVVELVTFLSPLEAYSTLANGVLPATEHLTLEVSGEQTPAAPGELVGGTLATVDLLACLAVLLGWAVCALGLGYLRFQRAEIE